MWPFRSKPKPPPAKGDLQTDLAQMDILVDDIALLFDLPGDGVSDYWIVDDPDVLRDIAEGRTDSDPSEFWSAVTRTPFPKPELPGFIWLLKARSLHRAYHLSDNRDFGQGDPRGYLNRLGAKARPVTWEEPYLRGRAEIEAMQERLWTDNDLFALEDLPDASDLQHDFTHAFRLKFPPTDAGPDSSQEPLQRVMTQAFPDASDLYVLGRIYHAPVQNPVHLALRAQGQLNATKNKKGDAPSAPLFQPEAWVYCEKAFFDHASRTIKDLMPPTALLSADYRQAMDQMVAAGRDKGAFGADDGTPFLCDSHYWLEASALSYSPQDYPFRYFHWPQ